VRRQNCRLPGGGAIHYKKINATPNACQRAVMSEDDAITNTLYVEPGSQWQNGCEERFHARLRDELF